MDSKANEALAKSVEAPSGSQQPAVPSKEKRARKKATETIEAKPQLSSSAVKKNQNAASVDDRASYVPNGQAAQVGVTGFCFCALLVSINRVLALERHRKSAGRICQSGSGLGSSGFLRIPDERCSARSAAAGGLLHAELVVSRDQRILPEWGDRRSG